MAETDVQRSGIHATSESFILSNGVGLTNAGQSRRNSFVRSHDEIPNHTNKASWERERRCAMTVPVRLQEEEKTRYRSNLLLPRSERRCAPCAQLKAQHGLCTDPHGDQQHCYCFLISSTHRLQHDQQLPDSWGEEEDWDGGLGSRAAVDRWEYEQEMHEEAIR